MCLTFIILRVQWRSPEEFAMGDLDEKTDVFSMGNNIYALLTGLWTFYEEENDDVVQVSWMPGLSVCLPRARQFTAFFPRKAVFWSGYLHPPHGQLSVMLLSPRLNITPLQQ